jgi:hypothetical protein
VRSVTGGSGVRYADERGSAERGAVWSGAEGWTACRWLRPELRCDGQVGCGEYHRSSTSDARPRFPSVCREAHRDSAWSSRYSFPPLASRASEQSLTARAALDHIDIAEQRPDCGVVDCERRGASIVPPLSVLFCPAPGAGLRVRDGYRCGPPQDLGVLQRAVDNFYICQCESGKGHDAIGKWTIKIWERPIQRFFSNWSPSRCPPPGGLGHPQRLRETAADSSWRTRISTVSGGTEWVLSSPSPPTDVDNQDSQQPEPRSEKADRSSRTA